MRFIAGIIVALSMAGTAQAQMRPAAPKGPPPPPLAVGAVVDRLEMVQDRTVYFEPAEGGRFKVVSVVDGNSHAAVPKVAGQVGVSFSHASEIGSVLDINSGLDFAFSYSAALASPRAEDGSALREVPVCAVGRGQITFQQWPASYPMVVLSRMERVDSAPPCD